MKMSDAIRGAAESAPVEDAHVSVSAVRSRARRNRGLRAGANGLVGVGAAALVFAGVMGVVANQTGAALADAPADGTKQITDNSAGAADIMPMPESANACGATFDAAAFVVDPATATITVNAVNDDALDISLNTTGAVDGEYTTGQPAFYVLWNGVYVGGTNGVTEEAWTWTSVAGETTSAPYTPPLVNCWDGAALPAGDYTIVSAQDVVAAAVEAPASEEPLPTASPAPSASVNPDTAVSSDAAASDAVVSGGATTTIVSAPAEFTVPGDKVDDPFGQYLTPIDPAPVVPTSPGDALTSAQARAAYEAALTSERWDMAKGSQRVVMTSASDDTQGTMWASSYYGCPLDGASASFPKESAELDWIDVSAKLPPSIHLSYGWIVDGNPVVSFASTNVTTTSLPGFYPGSAPRLVLVKDGRVVAEAYPVDPNQNGMGGGIAYAEGAPATLDSTRGGDTMIFAPTADGYLAPGETMGGDYVWRDLNGCWTSTGQLTVAPGTYTVLSAQDIYVGVQYTMMTDAAGATEGAVAPDASTSTDSKVAPAPVADDFTSYQVWSSLGTIRVTN